MTSSSNDTDRWVDLEIETREKPKERLPDRIDCIRYQVGVNMGDHAETTWHSFEVGDDETVRELMERLLPEGTKWSPRDYDHWVRLSFVEPRHNLTDDGHAMEGPF